MAAADIERAQSDLFLNPKSLNFFESEVPEIPPAFAQLLEQYSGVPSNEVQEWILKNRNNAWQVRPFPCIGRFRFVELNLSQRDDDNLYARLLARLKAGETFLDVGCCLGQDIRKLVFDGAPPQNVMGAELNPGFIDQGYALFRDHEKLAGRFVAPADILGDEGGAVAKLHGTFDVVQLGMILHLFTWEEQKTVFINAIDLLKKDKKGSLVIGQAVGDLAGLSRKTAGGGEKATYMHNGESFSKLIKEVGEATGTEWKVRAFLDPHIGMQKDRLAWNDAATRMLSFEIERA